MSASQYLNRAFTLARPFRTHPNPRVGAVIVDRSGAIVGEGAHVGSGHDHAEVVALDKAGPNARGATLYVTLEPCAHHGQTPPCVDALIQAGIERVVFGATDPDTRVAGKGMAKLRGAGIDVIADADADSARSLDPGYFHHRETGLPRVVLKFAMTLDGSIAAKDGSSKWITGEKARDDAHRVRSAMDAIAVGAGTVRVDDPLLSVRSGDAGHQPRPVILVGAGPLPEDARLWERSPLVISGIDRAIPAGDLLVVESRDGRPDPETAARLLAEAGYYDVLIEGGPTVAGEWWRAGLISAGVVYVAGKIGGGEGVAPLAGLFASLALARDVEIRSTLQLGNDVRIEFQ